MPYKSVAEAPAAVHKLPASAGKIWVSAFNRAMKKPDTSEASAFRIAWSAVSNAGFSKDQDGHWRKKRKHG